jgi:hypothetical protein
MNTVYFNAAFRRAALVATIALAPACANAEPGPALKALSEITLDIDHDGKMDRAVFVAPEGTGFPSLDRSTMFGEDERLDLYIYLGNGNEKLNLTRRPTFIVKDVIATTRSNQVFPLESRNGALVVKAARNMFGNWAPETLTIVHRKGDFWVAGYALNYELKNGARGECDINFLTGKGIAAKGSAEPQRIRERFVPIRPLDWPKRRRPDACEW